jgi:hypothetical protein
VAVVLLDHLPDERLLVLMPTSVPGEDRPRIAT